MTVPKCPFSTLELLPCDNYWPVTIFWPCSEVVIISNNYCTVLIESVPSTKFTATTLKIRFIVPRIMQYWGHFCDSKYLSEPTTESSLLSMFCKRKKVIFGYLWPI